MQNKGLVKTIAVLLTLVCCFYLSFSFVTRHYDSKAAAMSERDGQAYLDSLKNERVYMHVKMPSWLFKGAELGYTLKECREMEMGLGLDLKGGMNVVLEVSVPDVIDVLADHKQDAAYKKTMEEAKKDEETSQDDFITLFINRWKQNGEGRPLTAIFATQQMKGKVSTSSTDAEVEAALRTEVQSAIDNAENVVRQRVDKFGVVQPNIQRLEGQSRIMVEMPGVKEPERVRKLLQGSANLEFWETYNSNEIAPLFAQLDSRYAALKSNQGAETTDSVKSEEAAPADTAAAAAPSFAGKLAQSADKKSDADREQALKQNPLLSVLQPMNQGIGIVGYALARDTADVNKVIYSDVAAQVFPAELKLRWGAKAEDFGQQSSRQEVFALYALKITESNGRAPLEGDVITGAKDDFDQFGKPCVSMEMNSDGARRWSQITKKNIDKAVAIVLDDVVYSAPRILTQIDGGRSQITGNFLAEDTKDLANTLNSGKMPAPTRIVQEDVVGPSLGAESIQQGVISFIIAFVLLMVYMIMLYGVIPGLISDAALLLNLFFTLGILASFQAALTMPGIAGIVLTLGTAVDANVLIYERTKEELRRGLGVKDAIQKGYSNAFSAIFDSNFTSLITGIILLYFGTGPVKGFATTWIIGIIVSFFTAVFMTRLVYENRMKKDKWQDLTFTTGYSKNLMQNTKYNFVGNYKKSFTVWGVLAVCFVACLLVRGLSQSIDFTGGRNYKVVLNKEVPVGDVREAMKGVFVNTIGEKAGQEANTSVITLGAASEKTVRIQTNWNIESNDPAIDDQAETMLFEALKKAGLISQTNVTDFKNPDVREGGSIISSAKVGPSVAKTITYGAIISVIIALIAIFLYILVRFRNFAFSVGAIVALFLDALIVLGLYSALWGWVPMTLEIDQVFIGAILTVIGYSINDKVVVFDRIRENIGLYGKRDRQIIFNDSLNQTLARTINTSVTTLIVLLVIFFLGGDSIRSFSFAMILGVVFGTLSSIFIAAPVAYLTMGKTIKEADVPVEVQK